MKQFALILFVAVVLMGCKNPSNPGISLEDQITVDIAEIQNEAEILLDDPDAARDTVLELVDRINGVIEEYQSHMTSEDIDILNSLAAELETLAESITYNDQLESFSDLLGVDIVIPADPTPVQLYTISIQVETYRVIYGVTPEDAEQAIVDYGTDQGVIDTIFSLIEGTCTLEDLMVSESGMYTNEEKGIVIGLPLEDEIPEDSPISVFGTPTVVDDGEHVGMEFDSAEDYLLIPADETNNLTTEGTIEFWMKPSSIPNWAGIIHKGSEDDWSDESYSLQYAWGNAITLALCPYSGGFIAVRGTTDMSTRIGIWTHVVVTWNEEEAHIYLDGVDDTLMTTQNYDAAPVDFADFSPFAGSEGDVVVGKQVPGDTGYNFEGIISDVVIYNVYTEL